MKKLAKKQIVSMIAVLLLGGTLLTACSSSEQTATKQEVTTETTTETVKTVKAEEVVAEPTPEPTAEPTPEPTPEPVTYDGIDMESTLPGAEWIQTFQGIITEPKLVIFNDETNKKMIIEDGQEVEVEKGDVFVAYASEGFLMTGKEGDCFIKTWSREYYSELVLEEEFSDCNISVEFFGGESTIIKRSCKLICK